MLLSLFVCNQERAPVQQQYLHAYLSAQGLPPSAAHGSSKHSDYLKDVQRFLAASKQVSSSAL
jgi:hypothetical protein